MENGLDLAAKITSFQFINKIGPIQVVLESHRHKVFPLFRFAQVIHNENFINAELWGAPGNVPWAMKLSCERFPPEQYADFAGPLCYSPRHPTQLYEMMLEGFLLFGLLWLLSNRPRPAMTITGLFLLGYGLARSLVEFIRLPDAHIGYLLNTDWLTRGIVLSVPMIIVGLFLLILATRNRNAAIS